PTLSLADATVQHGLYVAPQAPPTIKLIGTRTKQLRCYPGHELCEALWQVRQGDFTSIGQTGHLICDGQVAVSLNGSSAPIHRYNRDRLSLQDEGAAEDYLRFFCAYVWGIGGSFYIDLPAPDAPEAASGQVRRVDENTFEAEVPLSYQGGRCIGTFRIPLDGAVSMENEAPLAGKARRPYRFHPPFIYGFPGEGEAWPQGPALGAMTVCSENLGDAERMLRPHVRLSSRLDGGSIILCDASCDTLDDDGGRAWGRRVALKLDRFSYSRQVTRAESSAAWEKGRDIAESRKAWLDLQLPEADRRPDFFIRPSNPDSYFPQPLAQQIAVLRNSGEEDAAIRLEKLKRDTEAWLAAVRRRPPGRWVAHILNFLNRALFGHLLSPARAFLTCLALIALGYAGFVIADERGMLSLDTAPVASVFASGDEGGPAAPLVAAGTAVTSPPCARAVNPLLYAADVFIPLVDLRQEVRCAIRTAPGWWSEATLWEILKALYAICGWVVISLAIITFTNVARRHGEPGS
ncbi:MAG TPA: hypothetical protein VEA61_15980, partial [Allosphingosinicella sp.]|nr:hypothetical protein [Allosphingosinicella sp.]